VGEKPTGFSLRVLRFNALAPGVFFLLLPFLPSKYRKMNVRKRVELWRCLFLGEVALASASSAFFPPPFLFFPLHSAKERLMKELVRHEHSISLAECDCTGSDPLDLSLCFSSSSSFFSPFFFFHKTRMFSKVVDGGSGNTIIAPDLAKATACFYHTHCLLFFFFPPPLFSPSSFPPPPIYG